MALFFNHRLFSAIFAILMISGGALTFITTANATYTQVGGDILIDPGNQGFVTAIEVSCTIGATDAYNSGNNCASTSYKCYSENGVVCRVASCSSCPSGYSLKSSSAMDKPCGMTISWNTCAVTQTCTAGDSYGSWRSTSTGYEYRTITHTYSNCSTSTTKEYRCASGYELDPGYNYTISCSGSGLFASCTGCIPGCQCSIVGYSGSCSGTNYSTCYTSCSRACTQQSCPSNATCTHGSTSTTGTQYYGGSCSAAASTCSITVTCNSGYHLDGGTCVSNTKACSGNLSGAQYGNITWNGSTWVYNGCYKDCAEGGIYMGYSYYTGSGWGTCKPISSSSGCHWGYYNNNGQSCISCPAGEWCYNSRYTCPAGYFCPGGMYDPRYEGYGSSYLCPAGSYCPAGTGSPKSCETGQYSGAGASSCSTCPPGYQVGSATTSESECVGAFTKTGSQLEPPMQTGCTTRTLSACTPGTCTYYKNYAGTITSDCTPTNCTKGQCCTSVAANYYITTSDNCTATPCSNYADYPLSDGGNITSAYCYKNVTLTGQQLEPPMMTGCNTRTLSACTPGTCTYKDYRTATDSVCTPTNCTKGQCCTSASANYYISSTDNCTAKSCSANYADYPLSDGGEIGNGYCYENVTLTGMQTACSQPENSASYTCGICTPGTCTYKDYHTATDTPCTPTDCTQPVKSYTCKIGTFDIRGYSDTPGCNECKNGPDNSHYTGTATSSNECPWECDDGYNLTSDNQCARYCMAGVTHIHLGTGLKIPLYASKRTTPSINVRHNGTVCYADLIEGESTGLHVKYNGKTYHAAE